MSKFKNTKGITLVALVVTIIVLIILAGVSISLVLGQDGVVQKAKQGRDNYADAARLENEQLANVDAFAMDIEAMIPSSPSDNQGIVTGTITNMTGGDLEISATVSLSANTNLERTKYVFITNSTPLGTTDESLYKDGTLEQANETVKATKKAGTYYLHVLATDTNGGKTEIISEQTATSQGKKDFDYTGNIQEIALTPGNYKLEVWGAQGGTAYSNSSTPGYGGYSSGNYIIYESQKIYLCIGGKGLTPSNSGRINGGYNGGGKGAGEGNYSNYNGASGGGATHIGLKNELLTQFSSDYSSKLLIVAGGGGGAAYCSGWGSWGNGHAGGYVGTRGGSSSWDSSSGGYGGTQSSGGATHSNYTASYGCQPGSFGQGGDGGNGGTSSGNNFGGAGGGGFYGGGGGSLAGAAGGGGSGYINTNKLTDAYMYGYNVQTSNETATKTYSTTNTSQVATSNYAKQGNGYARITALD